MSLGCQKPSFVTNVYYFHAIKRWSRKAWFVALRGKITDRAIRSCMYRTAPTTQSSMAECKHLRDEKILLKDIVSFVGHDGSPSDCYNLLWQSGIYLGEVKKKPVRTCSVAVGCVKQTRLSISKQQISKSGVQWLHVLRLQINRETPGTDDGAPPKSIRSWIW